MWSLDLAHPNNLNLALDPGASYHFGNATIDGDSVIGGNLTVGNSVTPANLTVSGNIINPKFFGTITGLTKSNVGLGNVDNTSDLSKPISTLTQTALNTKQSTLSINAPTGGFSLLTGTTVKGIIPSSPITITDTSGNLTVGLSALTPSSVGLDQVNNTSDLNKPISTLTQTALNAKQNAITPL